MSQDKVAGENKGLVQIGKNGKDFDPSRRKFLKVLGASSAAGLAACADSAKQNIFPNVEGDSQQIPGVAVWFNSTCTECPSACGISVRTREGRAVKLEGNPQHPVNRGSLCALGQSSLQGLYDPDRIRQPLRKTGVVRGKAVFSPISWEEAITRVATWIKESKNKMLITSTTSGAMEELLGEFSSKNGIKHTSYDLLEATAVAKASEIAFGVQGIPTYRFERAKTIVNFGSDFLETWISPCGYAKDWSIARRGKHPVRFVHIEPRLSLTGANADVWLGAKPGTEVRLALALLKIVVERGRRTGVRDDIRGRLDDLLRGVSVLNVAEECGVDAAKIALVAEYLTDSSPSLVLAGGTAASTEQQIPLMVVCNLLNLVLGNVGATVDFTQTRQAKSSLAKLIEQLDVLRKGEVDLLMVHGTNPAFSLPSSYGFEAAARNAAKLVSFSSYMDETTAMADLILPSHHSLESWGDMREVPGVYSLIQPAMMPLYQTRSFGDTVLQLSEKSGNPIAIEGGKDFQSYLKSSWKKLFAAVGSPGGDFTEFWTRSLDNGGYFAQPPQSRSLPQIASKALEVSFEPASFEHQGCSDEDPIVYPYPSVKGFDGSAANKPWLHELADPITQVVWDSWVEMHPDTAKKYGLSSDDIATVRNYFGEVNLPVYITPWVAPGIVAMPIGQGHTYYGRYASKVGDGNVLNLLPPIAPARNLGDGVPLLVTRAALKRGPGRSTMVNVQGSDSQLGRDLAQTTFITGAAAAAHGHDDHGDHGHNGHGHHEPKQMYEQRRHPAHKWGMAIDLAACTGCSACVVACYAENNIPVVGKTRCSEGREMAWLRIERYYDGGSEDLKVSFLPMLCQHCGNAPCEPVCPVYATYHNEEGLNAMIYNRCVGTRYCSNNCSYKVRRFNWFEYEWPESLAMQRNPDVTTRSVGVMEKCTFCVQRIWEAKDIAKDLGRPVLDGEIKPACVQTCPTEALTFGDLNDPESRVSKLAHDKRGYRILDHHLNTQPSITYLQDIKYKA
ncbi:MAG: molybdopterin-dependent oxidoreductase [Deltaproteobacteria bacterium]|nr:molybdopterin-dependent oxidoreductase [Deltaproteobacteria bacterium]